MRADKISISLERGDVAWLRQLARAQGTTLSAVVGAAVAARRQALARDQLLDALGAADLSREEIDAVHVEAFGR